MLPPFALGGASHIAAIGLVIGAFLLLVKLARINRPVWRQNAERALAVVLILNWPVSVIADYARGSLTLNDSLPLHICDLVSLLGAWALWTKNSPRASEGLWFWGMAGTLQGLLTPPLATDFPSLEFIGFFLLHGGVVLAALYVVFGRGLPHRPGALGRMYAWGLGYQIIVLPLNWLLGVNYGFLCSKPEGKSLFDVLGAWPWYLLSLHAVALVMFTALDLVLRWRSARLRASHRQKTPASPQTASHIESDAPVP